MATEDREDIQRAEKVTLKRKLTGPPRLLLGKTRSRSVGEDRPETRTDKKETERETAELTETANVDAGASSEVNVERSRGRCGAAGEDDDVRSRKVNRRRWWRRFSPAVVCNRKPKKVEEGLEEQKHDGSVPPEEALQEADAAGRQKTEENAAGTKGKTRFNMRTFRRFLTLSNVQQTHKQKTDFGEKDRDEASTTLQKKMRKFFTKDGKSRSSGVPLENTEDVTKFEEAPSSSAAQVDEPTESHRHVTAGSLETVTVAAESPHETATQQQPVCDVSVAEDDLTHSGNGSETIQTDSELVEGPKDTNDGSVKDLMELECPGKDEVVGVSTRVVLNAAELLSASTASSRRVHCEDETDETTSRSLQPSINGPSIRIELVPPDDVSQEEGEEECWEGSSSSENRHLLLLRERQLLQTARSLVRAAMNAAVDQLTREEQSDSGCVHREPPGCRDHA